MRSLFHVAAKGQACRRFETRVAARLPFRGGVGALQRELLLSVGVVQIAVVLGNNESNGVCAPCNAIH